MSSFLGTFHVVLFMSLSAAQNAVCVWNSLNSYDHLNGIYELVPGQTFEGYQYYIKNTTSCPVQYLHNYYDGNINFQRNYWQIYSSLVDYYIDHVPYCDASPHPSNPTSCVSNGGNWYEWEYWQGKKLVNDMTVTDGVCPSLNCDRMQLTNSGSAQCDKIFIRNTNYNNVFQNGNTYLYFNQNTFRWYCSDTLGINECGNDNSITHFYVSSKSDGWTDVTEGNSFQQILNNNNIATFNCLDTETPTHSPTYKPTLTPTLSTTQPSNQPSISPTAYTNNPTYDPTTINPTSNPTSNPTNIPTKIPSFDPTTDPTHHPTYIPTINPSLKPSVNPTINPTADPSNDPTVAPTAQPTIYPTYNPTTSTPTIRIIVPEYSPSPTEEQSITTTQYTNDLYTTISKNGLQNNNSGGILQQNYMLLIIIICSMIGILLICLIIVWIYIFKKRKNNINKNNILEMEAVKSVDSKTTPNFSDFALATTPNLKALNETMSANTNGKMGEVDLNSRNGTLSLDATEPPPLNSYTTPQMPPNNVNDNIERNESMDNDEESDIDELFNENHVTAGYDENEDIEKDIFDESDSDNGNDKYGELYSKPQNNNVTVGGHDNQFED